MRGQESDHIRFEPGTYYIGDPCYAIPDHEWMDYLNTYPKHENRNIGWVDGVAVTFKGHKCWHDSTAYGDGSYRGSDGFEYGVDAGIIGIIPTALINSKEFAEIVTNELGSIKTFTKPFFVWCEKDSTFHFDDITISTDGSQEDEDFTEDDDDGYDDDEEDEEDEE